MLNIGFNIEIESIKTGAYALTQKIDLDGFPEYLNLIEKPLLAHYAQAWKQRPHEKPDIIISDFLMIAALDLGELFQSKISGYFHLPFLITYGEARELDNEYISFFTPFFKFLPSDNAVFRTLKYTVKQIMSFMLNRMLVVKRNKLALGYGLDPVSTIGGNGLEFPSFTFFETYYGFEEPRLTPPYTEFIGPLKLKEFQTLNDPETTAWLKTCSSFIYVATGSMSAITEHQAKVFEQVFEASPYTFLVSSSSFTTKLPNVKVLDWVNQVEVLQHPRILAFVVHGGLTSIMEAIENLVPLVCLPYDKDHFYNCDRVEALSIGKNVFLDDFSVIGLSDAIRFVIEELQYRKPMEKLRIIMEDYSEGEKRIADAAIAFAKVGYQHLVPRWYSLPWYQKNELDIFAVYLGVLICIYKALQYCWSRCKMKQKVD